MTLAQLKEKRHAKARQAREILSKAEAESRDLTAEDRSSFDELDAQITELDGDIRRVEKLDGELREGHGAEHIEQTAEQREAEARADRERIAAFRAREGRDPTDEERASGLEGLGGERRIAATMQEYRAMTYGGVPQNEDAFRQAFYRYMTVSELREQSRDELRVMSTATNPGGGYIVPTTFERTLIERARDFGVMRQIATVETTSTGEKITAPMEDTHGVASWLATNAAYAESDEAFLQVTLDAFKAGTLIRVAEELLQDSAFDLEAYIARQFAARIGILENTAYVVGDGVGKPTGIVTSAAVGRTMPVGSTTGFPAGGAGGDEIIRLMHSVLMAYRNRGAFLMKDATMLAIRLLKDGQGNYLWRPGLEANSADTLVGRPLYVDPDMPTMAANAKAVLFGDFSAYVIRDVQGVGIQRLNELYAANGQVGFRAYHRTEGKLLNPDAVKALANSAT